MADHGLGGDGWDSLDEDFGLGYDGFRLQFPEHVINPFLHLLRSLALEVQGLRVVLCAVVLELRHDLVGVCRESCVVVGRPLRVVDVFIVDHSLGPIREQASKDTTQVRAVAEPSILERRLTHEVQDGSKISGDVGSAHMAQEWMILRSGVCLLTLQHIRCSPTLPTMRLRSHKCVVDTSSIHISDLFTP